MKVRVEVLKKLAKKRGITYPQAMKENSPIDKKYKTKYPDKSYEERLKIVLKEM